MREPPKDISLAWIDSNPVMREAMECAFRTLCRDLSMVPFQSISDAMQNSAASWQIVAYAHHRSDGNLAAILETLGKSVSHSGILIVLDTLNERDYHQLNQFILSAPSRPFGIVSAESSSVRMLHAAIKFIVAGGVFLPPSLIASTGPSQHSHARGRKAADALTAREEQVRTCIRAGQSNKIIAFNLGLSESTIKVFVRNLMRKTGAENRVQVALTADQNGHDTNVMPRAEREKMD